MKEKILFLERLLRTRCGCLAMAIPRLRPASLQSSLGLGPSEPPPLSLSPGSLESAVGLAGPRGWGLAMLEKR